MTATGTVNRRQMLKTSAAAGAAFFVPRAEAPVTRAAPKGQSPADRAAAFRLRPGTWKRILAGHEAILAELKPSRAQLDRGLELHYGSYVADTQGNLSVTYEGGLVGDRLLADKNLNRARARTFDSAYDQQWIEESRAIYAITGVKLGSEDVAHPNENDFHSALELLTRSNYVYERRQDLVRVGGWDDVERAERQGQVAVVAHLAGVGCFAEVEDPLRNLDLFYMLGVRMSQLTYIQQNRLCCSWLQEEDSGLTALGRKVVARMNQLGIMVDVAHCGHRSAMEIVEASAEPVFTSHTGCKAIHDDRSNQTYLDAVFAQPYARGVARPRFTGNRNVEDELIRALARKGGLVSILSVAYMLGSGPSSFDTWYRHVEHVITAAGIDHVAIGSDQTFFPSWKPTPMDWTNWPYFTVGLVCRGLKDEEIRKVIGGNYRRFARQILDIRPWGELL